jgi:hypothetical protein
MSGGPDGLSEISEVLAGVHEKVLSYGGNRRPAACSDSRRYPYDPSRCDALSCSDDSLSGPSPGFLNPNAHNLQRTSGGTAASGSLPPESALQLARCRPPPFGR